MLQFDPARINANLRSIASANQAAAGRAAKAMALNNKDKTLAALAKYVDNPTPFTAAQAAMFGLLRTSEMPVPYLLWASAMLFGCMWFAMSAVHEAYMDEKFRHTAELQRRFGGPMQEINEVALVIYGERFEIKGMSEYAYRSLRIALRSFSSDQMRVDAVASHVVGGSNPWSDRRVHSTETRRLREGRSVMAAFAIVGLPSMERGLTSHEARGRVPRH